MTVAISTALRFAECNGVRLKALYKPLHERSTGHQRMGSTRAQSLCFLRKFVPPTGNLRKRGARAAEAFPAAAGPAPTKAEQFPVKVSSNVCKRSVNEAAAVREVIGIASAEMLLASNSLR